MKEKVYEVELSGFDYKEDVRDGASSQIIWIATDETDSNKIIKEAIKLGHKYIHWNPKLSKVLRCLKDCEIQGYNLDILHKLTCKKCKRTFIGNTENEVINAWRKHANID
jgi:hypothetical protein